MVVHWCVVAAGTEASCGVVAAMAVAMVASEAAVVLLRWRWRSY